MRNLKVALLAHHGAAENVFEEGKAKLVSLLGAECVDVVDTEADLLFFLSGGSERRAVDILKPGGFYVLLAFEEGNSHASATEVKAYANEQGIRTILLDCEQPHEEGNSHASATEVKAYANEQGIRTILLDCEQPHTAEILKSFMRVKDGLQRLRGQRLGLIGEVSDWLVASTIEADRLREKLGIELRQIPWDGLANFQDQDADTVLLERFRSQEFDLRDTAKVYTLLNDCIRAEQLDAITVECFPLVVEHAVTACLPLAQFNADGLPAGCEGDITSITGMMLAKALTGCVPWLANTAGLGESRAAFAHCTVAPNLLREFSISTHFETGQGTAIQGYWDADEIVLFRLDRTLTKAFLTTTTVLERPKSPLACRMQIEVSLPPEAATALRERPLGNHHLILPAEHAGILKLAFRMLRLELQ